MSTALVEPSNEALEYPLSASTRHTGFSLDQSKQTNNLKKDALVVNYDTVVNNYNENVNVKCSSGFYLKVANPALLFLAKQSANLVNSLVINTVKIHCTNSDVSNCTSGNTLGTVTIHSHVSTRLVQLQGSKLIAGFKAPVWFFKNVLKNTYDHEAVLRKTSIDEANKAVMNIPSGDTKCNLCDKKYKTAPNLQKHIITKHETLTLQTVEKVPQKRIGSPISCLIDSDDYSHPPKTIAYGSVVPESISYPAISNQRETTVCNSDTLNPLEVPVSQSLTISPIVLSPCSTTISSFSSVSSVISLPSLNTQAHSFVPNVTLNFTPGTSTFINSAEVLPPPFYVCPDPSASLSSSEIPPTASTPSVCTNPQMATHPLFSRNAPTAQAFAPSNSKPAAKKSKAKGPAITPEEFEKENLKVERDACRLKMTELATDKKDLSETIDILTTRCRLLEQERNKSAVSKVAPEALAKEPSPSLSPTPTPPIPATTPLESLINLEVLKSIKRFLLFSS